MDKRIGPYLELGTSSAFTIGDLFNATAPLALDIFVICDSFGTKPIPVGGKVVKAGMPILYYRAHPEMMKFDGVGIGMGGAGSQDIYNYMDNFELLNMASWEKPGQHLLHTNDGTPQTNGGLYFYDVRYKIVDQKVFGATGKPWPYRPDSYILISAGADGLYGTADDITNF